MNIRVMLDDINLAAHPTLLWSKYLVRKAKWSSSPNEVESILRELSISLSYGTKELLIKVDKGEQSVCFTNDTRIINTGKEQPAQWLK